MIKLLYCIFTAIPLAIGLVLMTNNDITDGVLFCILGSIWWLILVLDYVRESIVIIGEMLAIIGEVNEKRGYYRSERNEDKDIKISESLRLKLKILCTTKSFRSYDELINEMLNFYCEKKGIDISIKVRD